MYAMEAQREWADAWREAISETTYKIKVVMRNGESGVVKEPRFSARILPARHLNRQTGAVRNFELKLEHTHIHVLSAMMRYAAVDDLEGEHCFCRASNSTIAEQTRMSVSLVEKTISDLVAVGLIQRISQAGSSSITKLFRTTGNWHRESLDKGTLPT